MLEISQLKKGFKDRRDLVQAIDGIDLTVNEGEFLVLLGPSGCGKTTTLRTIAGLERPDEGEIKIDQRPVYSDQQGIFLPPEQRPIAMVFQSYAIWPHLTVYDNVALPLTVGNRRLNKEERDTRVREVLVLLGLENLADRKVTALSGGQQQRVSLARAIAQRPKVLLMDEPLSNLDYKLRVRLRTELRDLMRQLNLTTVYVTHDQEEALAMGDRIAVLNQGEIVQIGPAREIYQRPRTEFVARFIGEMNFIEGTVVRQVAEDQVLLNTPLGEFAAYSAQAASTAPGERKLLGIRPTDIEILAEERTEQEHTFKGEITASQFLGESIDYTVQSGEISLQVKAHHRIEHPQGAQVTLFFPPSLCIVLEADSN